MTTFCSLKILPGLYLSYAKTLVKYIIWFFFLMEEGTHEDKVPKDHGSHSAVLHIVLGPGRWWSLYPPACQKPATSISRDWGKKCLTPVRLSSGKQMKATVCPVLPGKRWYTHRKPRAGLDRIPLLLWSVLSSISSYFWAMTTFEDKFRRKLS